MPVSESAARSEAEKQREMALEVWVKKQDRLGAVSYRLTRASAELCGEQRAIYGFVAHDVGSYSKDYREAAIKYFGLGDCPVVRNVQPNFPAALAGLQPGDSLKAINGKSVEGKTTLQAMEMLLKASSSTDSLKLDVRRKGQILNLSMLGVPACDYPVLATEDDVVNAYADGEKVFIASGMLRFTEDDDELAFVVGHELSHDALGHIGKKKGNSLLGAILDVAVAATTGVNTGGMFSNAAANAFSQRFEAEADYEGLYMAARAGFDITKAPNFWRRMAAEHPGSIKKNFTASHPSTPERFIAMENAVTEIQSKRNRGIALVPEKASERGPSTSRPTSTIPTRPDSAEQSNAGSSRVPSDTLTTARATRDSTKQHGDAPFKVILGDGSVIPARSVRPWGVGQVKVTSPMGQSQYIDSSSIRSILDQDGHDWTEDVVDRGKRLPRE